ncbi:MAG: D-glucuronyl C5-epimerase family protein [Desulfomonilaceae bacterium]
MKIGNRITSRAQYLKRIFKAYIFSRNSNLTFWHEKPMANSQTRFDELGPYYMTFEEKALYPGPFDDKGIPLLDYHGQISKQYYSIAISQYALGNYNLFKKTSNSVNRDRFMANAQWLLDNLKFDEHETYLWTHTFDFEYFRTLKAPWFSGLAQGQGLSVLVRAFAETRASEYLNAADQVYETLKLPIQDGGVVYRDETGSPWIEEYLVEPPTHILNGFIWALWGVYDYWLLTKKEETLKLFQSYVDTIEKNLGRYDSGFWSYYELTPQRVKCLASNFYHRLHIVQLKIMHEMTGRPDFLSYSDKWSSYLDNPVYRNLALAYKVGFKLAYY